MSDLFRKEAVEHLSSPDRLDARLKVLAPKYVMPLAAIAIIMAAALAWSIWGRVTVYIEGRGLLIRAQHVVELQATSAQVVTKVLVRPGGAVHKDDVLAEVVSADSSGPQGTQFLKAPSDGQLADSLLKPGWRLRKGEVYGAIGVFGGKNTQLCVTFLKLSEGQLAHPGMRAFVVPEVARSAQLGAIQGKIVYVRAIPTDGDHVAELIDSKTFAEMLIGGDRLMTVIVEMPIAAHRSPEGEMVPVAPRSLAGVRVEVERKPPLAFLFPALYSSKQPKAASVVKPNE